MSELVPQNSQEPDDEDSTEWADDPKKMGFLDHLEELRWTLIKPLIVFVITFVVVMVFIRDVKDVLMYPLAQNLTEDKLAAFDGLATRNMTGVYSAMLHIGLIVGTAVTSPFIVYYLGKFLAPALTKKERRVLLPGSVGVLVLFLLGCSFSFFLLLPKAIGITMAFNEMMGFVIIWSPESYFGFITWIVIGMGLTFQFPLAAVVLVYLDIVSVQKLRSMRRLFILIFFIVAALLTPPDPVTQTMMAVPMIVLYELAIWVAAIVVRKRDEKAEALERELDED